jgi:transcriptional regulator with XRE-family HTH domain
MATNARQIGKLTRSIVAEIRARRVRLDMTQEALAEKSGVPLPTLGKIERLQAPIDVEQLERIAIALGITPDELVADALSNAAVAEAAAAASAPESKDHIEQVASRKRAARNGTSRSR